MMNAGGKETTSSLPVVPHGDQEEENGVQAPAHQSAFPEANQVAGRRQKPLCFSLQATSWLLPRPFGLIPGDLGRAGRGRRCVQGPRGRGLSPMDLHHCSSVSLHCGAQMAQEDRW